MEPARSPIVTFTSAAALVCWCRASATTRTLTGTVASRNKQAPAVHHLVVGYPGYTMGTEAPLPTVLPSRSVSLSGGGVSIGFTASSQANQCPKSRTGLVFIKSKDAQTFPGKNEHTPSVIHNFSVVFG